MAYDLIDIVFGITARGDAEGNDHALTCADKAVLFALAVRADNTTYECWPGYGEIADRAMITRRAAIDSVEKLRRLGVFKSLLRGGADSPYASNFYALDAERLKTLRAPSKQKRPRKSKTTSVSGKTYTKRPPEEQKAMAGLAKLTPAERKQLEEEFNEWHNDQISGSEESDFTFEQWYARLRLASVSCEMEGDPDELI